MRSILLHIHDDACLTARTQVALDLARGFNGHITFLQASPYELGVPGDMYGIIAVDLLPELRKQADALRERLEADLRNEDVAWTWVQEDGLAVDHLLSRSGLSDVIVLGSCEPYGRAPSLLVGEIVLRSRTPVMIVPPGAKKLDWSGAAVVAWDGSAEASRALRAALPLLAKANSVTLVTILGENERRTVDLPPVEGAQYLSRHGIPCELTELSCSDTSIAQGLARAAVSRGASYLVMGAYGHSRLRETIWGGVTRELFTDPPLPILACH